MRLCLNESSEKLMKYRLLGKTGEKVSALGFGIMRMPMVDNDYSRIDYQASAEMVHYAVEHGVNYLDTSWPYHSHEMSGEGDSEPFVGKIVKEIGRDKVFIATKMPIWQIRSKADMQLIFHKQLKRLQTDYVDFYLVHNIRRLFWDNMVRLELFSFLDSLQREGKVRHIGFSFHGTSKLFHEALDYYDFEFCQHICNYHNLNFQAGIQGLRLAHRKGLGVIAMEPVMGGILADQLPKKAQEVLAATGIKRSFAGWALRWVWNRPEINFLLSGMHTLDQVKENIALAEDADTPLTAAEMEAIDEVQRILNSYKRIPCTGCDLCSCPKDIDIRSAFEVYNDNQVFKPISICMMTYDVALKDQGNDPVLCDNCGECVDKCPQGIDIPYQLRKIVAKYR